MARITLRQIVEGLPAKDSYGRRRAVIQCIHGERRYVVGEVRGDTVLGVVWPHSLEHATHDIYVSCSVCPEGSGRWILDLGEIRSALRAPHSGIIKLAVTDVARRVEN